MMYLIAYDISSNKRRRKVLDALRDFGLPVQRSVAECELDAARLQTLWRRLTPLVDRRKDQVRIYPLCQSCYFRGAVLGSNPLPGFEPAV